MYYSLHEWSTIILVIIHDYVVLFNDRKNVSNLNDCVDKCIVIFYYGKQLYNIM